MTTIKPTYIIIAILAFLLGWQTCNGFSKNKVIDKLALQNQRLDTLVNTLGQQVIVSKTEVALTQEAMRAATDSFFNLRKEDERKIRETLAFYKANTKTVIKEVPVPYVDKPKQKEWEDSVKLACQNVIDFYEANMTAVPREAKDSTATYEVALTVTKDNVVINNLTIPNTQTLRFVELKGGFLKKDQDGKRHLFTKRSFRVDVINSNTLIQTTGTTSAVYQPPKKKNLLFKAILVGTGIFIGTKL